VGGGKGGKPIGGKPVNNKGGNIGHPSQDPCIQVDGIGCVGGSVNWGGNINIDPYILQIQEGISQYESYRRVAPGFGSLSPIIPSDLVP
jgi:hypothetical protein